MNNAEELKNVEALCERMRCVEESAARDREQIKELQSQFVGLKASIEKALSDLMPKVEALLNNQGNHSLPSVTSRSTPSCLLDAAEAGDVEKVLQELEAGADPRQRNPNGQTALHLAASGGYERCVVCLLGIRAKVDVIDRFLRTPLHYAAEKGHLGVARHLLKAGTRVDCTDAGGSTPLMLSVANNHPELVAVLLQYKASPSIPDRNGYTVLLKAAKTGKWNIVEIIAQSSDVNLDETDEEGTSVLVYATRAQERNVVKLLLEKDASYVIEGRKYSTLQIAVELCDEVLLRQLLSRKDTHEREEIIAVLCRVKNTSVMWMFEDYYPGILHGESGQSAMRFAAQYGFLDSLECLLDGGVDINAVKKGVGKTALMLASAFGKHECVKVLLNRGALINITDDVGSTALHEAAKHGEAEIVGLLLQAGADPDVKNNNQKTPLDIAKTPAVRQLLSTN